MATHSAVGLPVRGLATEATTEGDAMTNETEKLIEEAQRYVEARVLPGDYRTPQELVEELVASLRRAEAERDDFRALSDLRNSQHDDDLRHLAGCKMSLHRAEKERDAQAKEFARFKAVAALADSVVRWDSLLNEMHKQKAKVSELTATRDLLTAENARLQREHNAYVQRLSADALQVASKYQRERDEARAQVATLELLQRGGK